MEKAEQECKKISELIDDAHHHQGGELKRKNSLITMKKINYGETSTAPGLISQK